MGRLALVVAAVLLLGATACGSAAPLGNLLVYAKPNVSGPGLTIWRAGLDGSHATRLTSGDLPAVSPDGRWIAFARGSDLLVMPAAGGAAKQVYAFRGYELVGRPTWAPDSRQLAFLAGNTLVVLDPFSHRAHTLARNVPESSDAFSYSPDSRKIAYIVIAHFGYDMYVVPARGGTPVRLMHHIGGLVWGKPGIAFSRADVVKGNAEIWLSDGNGRHLRRLTHDGIGTAPVAFSADGNELLATSSGRLWAVDVATGDEHPLTPLTGSVYPEGLSADGRTVLATVCDYNIPPAHSVIETIPFAGGKPHVIVHGPCDASWNAH